MFYLFVRHVDVPHFTFTIFIFNLSLFKSWLGHLIKCTRPSPFSQSASCWVYFIYTLCFPCNYSFKEWWIKRKNDVENLSFSWTAEGGGCVSSSVWKIGPRLALHEPLSVFFHTPHTHTHTMLSTPTAVGAEDLHHSCSFLTAGGREVFSLEKRLQVLSLYSFACRKVLRTVYVVIRVRARFYVS